MNFTGTFKPVDVGTIIVYQGADFKKQFIWTMKNEEGESVPVDLTGAIISAQVRKRHTSPILLDMTPYISVTDGAGGKFEVHIPSEDTESLNFDVGIFQMEVRFTDDVVVRLLEGFVELSREVVH